jgi:hypothetical protein
MGFIFIETSAKTNTGVMEAFSDLVIRVSPPTSLFPFTQPLLFLSDVLVGWTPVLTPIS